MSSVWGQRAVEWRVDLGDMRSIHHIVIGYMTGNKVWGTVFFKGTISLFSRDKLIISVTFFNIV